MSNEEKVKTCNFCLGELIPAPNLPEGSNWWECVKCGTYAFHNFSPPPVIGDVREQKILICLEVMLKSYQDRVNGKITTEEFRKAVLAFPGSILTLLKEAGYVKLIPDPLKGTPIIKDIAKFVDSASEEGT